MQLFEESRINELKENYKGKRFSKPYIVSLATDPKFENERQRLEKWFEMIPEKNKANIKAKLLSENKNQLFSAYSELVIAQFLRTNGLVFEFEPELEEGEPDFLVKAFIDFYLEVRSIFEAEEVAKEHRSIRLLLDELNKINHHFYLRVQCLRPQHIPNNIDYCDIKDFVKKWMDNIDPAQLSESNIVENYNRDGLRLKLTLMPRKSSEKGPIIGGWTPSFCWVKTKRVIRYIKEKAQKYKSIKELGVPYVIALSLEDIFLDLEDIIYILFGRNIMKLDQYRININANKNNTGLFVQKHGLDSETQNTRLSVVIMIRKRMNNYDYEHNFTILHNPYSSQPLPYDIFDKYSQLIPIEQNDENIIMKWTRQPNEYELL